MNATKGNCYLCGAELGKAAMKNHICKEHDGPVEGQECCLLKIEGAYDKNYWLYLDIPVNRTLSALDAFLRKIWLECCGHMSDFRGVRKGTKLGDLKPGDSFIHEYDYGDTTETLVTVVGRIYRPAQKEIVRLLARNVPPVFACAKCGAPADFICAECQYDSDNPFYCKKCGRRHEHDDMLLAVTNSPRMGVCGYEGELDTFAYVPPQKVQKVKPAPRQKPPAKPKAAPKQIYPDGLYDLAFALRKVKLWDKMPEDQIFATPLPDGETGYLSVMGSGGEHLSLALYLGQRGLESFRTIQSMGDWDISAVPPSALKLQEAALSQCCLQCSFESKSELSEEELASVRLYAAPRKIRFSGPKAFPQFMKYSPARLPAPVSEEGDVQLLCQAIKAALAVAGKLEEAGVYGGRKALGFSFGLAHGRSYPLLTPEGDAFTWSVQHLAAQPAPEYPAPILQDELLRERLKRAQKENTSWVCDLVMVPSPVAEEEGGEPYFPYTLLAVDTRTEAAFPPVLVRDYEREAEALLHGLGEKMLEQGPPRQLIVTDGRTYSFLRRFASAVQIDLVQNARDALLEGLEEDFFDVADFIEDLDDPETGALPGMVEALLADGDEETLLGIPAPVWEGLRRIVEEEGLPEDIRARFQEMDRKRRH